MAAIMTIVQLVIYIFIFKMAFRIVRQKKDETVKNQHTQQTSSSVTTVGGGTYSQKPTQARPSTTQATRTSGVSSPNTSSQSTATYGEEPSVTEYLSQKAQQDQVEHAREKREESRRLMEKAGGLQAAERLYEGDMVPPHKHCVICHYCAAENLIPDGSRMRYSCYFCREPLD